MQRPVSQSRLITWFLWLHIARTCRVRLLLNEVERLKWCAGDQIRNAAVKDRDVLTVMPVTGIFIGSVEDMEPVRRHCLNGVDQPPDDLGYRDFFA